MLAGKYLAVGVGTLGATGVGGTSIYIYGFRGDTLEIRVKNYFEGRKHMTFLNSLTSTEIDKFKEFYFHSKDEKPVDIDKLEIFEWCENKLPSRDYSSFELVKKWCVINTRSLKDEALADNRKLIPTSASAADSEWQTAWNTYKSKKGNLAILDTAVTTAETTASDTNGTALKTWCEAKSSRHMYEYLGEDKVYEKYRAWCTKE